MMRYYEILTEKKHKRKHRKPHAPTIRYGYMWGGGGDHDADDGATDSDDVGGGDAGGDAD